MKALLGLSMILAAASVASAAAPTLSGVCTDIGGGLIGTDISVSDGSSVGSWAINLTITGADGAVLNQLKAFGAMSVNTESDATSYAAIGGSGYVKATDTWYYNSIFTTVLPTGVNETANGFHSHVGTAAGANWGGVNVLHIASTTGNLNYSGTIGRGGQNYSISGVIPAAVPEPVSMGLLGTGALIMLRRRRHA